MNNRQKIIILLSVILLAGVLGGSAYHHRQILKQEAAVQAEAQKEAEEKAEQERREAEKKHEEELKAEAQKIQMHLKDAATDENVCGNLKDVLQTAQEVEKEIAAYEELYKGESEELLEEPKELLEETRLQIETLRRMKSIDKKLEKLYTQKDGSVAMGTSKNNKIFQKVQQEIWKIPDEYPKKLASYEAAVQAISAAWDYQNDEWHYESSTLKVTVEPLETSYTKYWVCHVQTFSTQQLCSALCGGTYGNPRAATSVEMAAHNGVIGVNGSGFSYSSGIPAEGKSMIKDGKVYNDVYSNGNIMCVTQDGGMFTAVAGMTTEEMLSRGVRDTYCFGPTLVENGKACEISGQFRQTYRYQRTAVGMVNPGDYYLVVVDGKGAGGSQGMTYEEITQVFLDLDCQYAYMMDGGGSTTLVFKGRVINSLTDGGKERPCADILYFIDAGDGLEGDEIIIYEEEAMLKPPSD